MLVTDDDGALARLRRIQADIATARDELELLAFASLPQKERADRVKQALDLDLARYDVGRRIAHLARPGPFAVTVDAHLIGWLLQDLLEAAAVQKLSVLKPVADALSPAERKKRITALRKQLAELERAEELEVLALEAAGVPVLRRADADPAVVLDVWEDVAVN